MPKPKRKTKRVTKPASRRTGVSPVTGAKRSRRSPSSTKSATRKRLDGIRNAKPGAEIRRSRFRMSPLLANSWCKVCRLSEIHPDLFDTINGHFIEGGSVAAISAHIKRAHPKLDVGYNSLTRHRKRHLIPATARAQELKIIGDSIAEALGSKTPVNLAMTVLREIAIAVHWTTMELLAGSDDAIQQMLNPDFQSLLRIGADVAGKLSTVERSQIQTDLDRANLKLKEFLVAMKSGDAMKAVRMLLTQAADRMSPETRAEVAAALEAIGGNAKALPA